jgi:predicted  nucleic acid-binding Zn-ribbon protein
MQPDGDMKRMTLFLFLLALLASCATIQGQRHGDEGLLEQLRAENRLMKRNSELALRENEVLKTENARYRSEANNMKKKLERLRNDIEALNMKYTEDVTRANDAFDHLSGEFAAFRQESDEKNRALTEAYALLEQISDERRDRIAVLETAAGEQAEQIRQRESDLRETAKELQRLRQENEELRTDMRQLSEKLKAHQETAARPEGEADTGGTNGNPDGMR